LPDCAIQEPVHPHATLDIVLTQANEPVLIDVLDNDWDSNGGDVSIMHYTEQTVPGGYVEITSVSDEIAGPRQALLYTPPEGYVGKDLVIYTRVVSCSTDKVCPPPLRSGEFRLQGKGNNVTQKVVDGVIVNKTPAEMRALKKANPRLRFDRIGG
jgi:hypothetical protein